MNRDDDRTIFWTGKSFIARRKVYCVDFVVWLVQARFTDFSLKCVRINVLFNLNWKPIKFNGWNDCENCKITFFLSLSFGEIWQWEWSTSKMLSFFPVRIAVKWHRIIAQIADEIRYQTCHSSNNLLFRNLLILQCCHNLSDITHQKV